MLEELQKLPLISDIGAQIINFAGRVVVSVSKSESLSSFNSSNMEKSLGIEQIGEISTPSPSKG